MDLKERILEKVNIADIIGQYVTLIPSGREFKACCPFHQEKTPSFYVMPEKNFYHCFGCRAWAITKSITLPLALQPKQW